MTIEDIRDELAYIINSKVDESKLSFRVISGKSGKITPSLLSKVRNYNLEGVSTERLILLIGQLEVALGGVVSGIDVIVDST
ncbi:hypothetical protein QTV49_004888 [Vibrio vulnificus]|nr:hypothetical protein [Vibrio vulnificus]